MRIGKFAALGIGIGLLASCSTPRVEPGMLTGKQYPSNPVVTPCSGATCPVTVTITHTPLPNFTCTITVDPPIYDLSVGPSPKTITWTVTNPNFVWPQWSGLYLPIQFEQNAEGVFSNPTITPSANSVSVTYTRPSTGGNHYAYGTTLRHRALSRICSKDPFFVD